jgi:betaine lipid synthase
MDILLCNNPFTTVAIVGAFSTACLVGFAALLWTRSEKCRHITKFFWNCFVKPFGVTEGGWGGALEGFYAGQADVYDATRQGLLKGRTTMMKLAASHLKAGVQAGEKGKMVWVDVQSPSPLLIAAIGPANLTQIGGGTGWNVERMNELYPLRDHFRKVYIVDLSPSLCNVARERIQRLRLGDVVQVLCDDAVTFDIPDFPDAEGNIDLITMSYSLSMMPSYNL